MVLGPNSSAKTGLRRPRELDEAALATMSNQELPIGRWCPDLLRYFPLLHRAEKRRAASVAVALPVACSDPPLLIS